MITAVGQRWMRLIKADRKLGITVEPVVRGRDGGSSRRDVLDGGEDQSVFVKLQRHIYASSSVEFTDAKSNFRRGQCDPPT